MTLAEQEMLTLSKHLISFPGVVGVHIAYALVCLVMYLDFGVFQLSNSSRFGIFAEIDDIQNIRYFAILNRIQQNNTHRNIH